MIIKENLEKLLMRSWDKFIDQNKLISYALQQVRDANLQQTKTKNKIKSIIKLKVSRFDITNKGYVIWVEFELPYPDSKLAVGTCELTYSHDGENLIRSQTIGEILYN